MNRTRRSTRIVTALAAVTALTLVPLSVTACAPGSSGSEDGVTLTFWDGNAIPERTEVWNRIIDEFEQQNPGVTVDYVGLPQDSSGQKFDTAIATGSGPDVGVLPRGDVSSYQAQNALLPLDEHLEGSPLAAELSETYLDQVRGNVLDGKLYALPTHALQDTIWYRPDLFAAAGVAPPDTWADLRLAADALTDSSAGQFGFTIRGGEGAGFHILSDMYTASGITEFFDASGATTIDDPRNAEALQGIVDLYGVDTPKADVTNNYTNMLAQFQGGRIAMMQHNIGSYPTLLKSFDSATLAPLPMPRSAPGAGRILLSSQLPSIGMFASENTTEHQEEAWAFLEFAMNAENDGALAEIAAGIPVNTEAQQQQWVQESPAIQMALGVVEDPSTTVVQTAAYLPEFNSIIASDVEPMFQDVLLGKATVQDLLSMWADEIDEAQAKYEGRTQ